MDFEIQPAYKKSIFDSLLRSIAKEHKVEINQVTYHIDNGSDTVLAVVPDHLTSKMTPAQIQELKEV